MVQTKIFLELNYCLIVKSLSPKKQPPSLSLFYMDKHTNRINRDHFFFLFMCEKEVNKHLRTEELNEMKS